MNIWNRVLIGLICVASLAFFYLAARTLRTHEYWRSLAQDFSIAIQKTKLENEKIADNAQGEPGIRQIRAELNSILANRGRMWRNCDAQVKVDKAKGTAEVRITIPKSAPGLSDKGKLALYAFEEGNAKDQSRYLGEFVVTGSTDTGAALKPTTTLPPAQLERLTTAKPSWVLYEGMPADNHEAYAGLSEAELKAQLPAATVEEYLKHGKPAAESDAQERIADGKYQRALRDYAGLFHADRNNWTEMLDRFASTKHDKDLIDSALKGADDQVKVSEKQIAAVQKELEQAKHEQEIVVAYCTKLKNEVNAVQAEVAKLFETNRAMAGQLHRLQWDALRRIDQRTRAMAQANGGGI